MIFGHKLLSVLFVFCCAVQAVTIYVHFMQFPFKKKALYAIISVKRSSKVVKYTT